MTTPLKLETPPVETETTPLNRFGRMYLASMKENRPRMYQEAEQSGKLDALALAAQNQAEERVVDSILIWGMHPMEAQSLAMSELLLPDEEQVPDLNQNPFTLP